MQVCVGVTCASFDYITDCITCTECDLDVSSVVNISTFSYHWMPVSESGPPLGPGRCVCCVKGGTVSFCVIGVGSLRLLHREFHWSLQCEEWCSILCIYFWL